MVDITIEQVTDGDIATDPNGVLSWEGSGVFDKLIKSVNENLDIQYRNQRITGSDYAMVYSNSLIAVMQQAIEFVLRKNLTEAQIEEVNANIALKEVEKKTMYTQRIKLDKEAALLGLDDVLKTANVTPETIYTPKYEE